MTLTPRGRRVAALAYWAAGIGLPLAVAVALPTIALHLANTLTGS